MDKNVQEGNREREYGKKKYELKIGNGKGREI